MKRMLPTLASDRAVVGRVVLKTQATNGLVYLDASQIAALADASDSLFKLNFEEDYAEFLCKTSPAESWITEYMLGTGLMKNAEGKPVYIWEEDSFLTVVANDCNLFLRAQRLPNHDPARLATKTEYSVMIKR